MTCVSWENSLLDTGCIRPGIFVKMGLTPSTAAPFHRHASRTATSCNQPMCPNQTKRCMRSRQQQGNARQTQLYLNHQHCLLRHRATILQRSPSERGVPHLPYAAEVQSCHAVLCCAAWAAVPSKLFGCWQQVRMIVQALYCGQQP